MHTTFVLMDCENVQPNDVGRLAKARCQVRLFYGVQQKRLPVAVAAALQPLGNSAEYVQIHGVGPNALDFHLAYYLGRLAVASPTAHFHIISKDTGFDVLIAHLNAHGVVCRRHASLTELPLPGAASTSVEVTKDLVVQDLVKRKAARPRTLQTLAAALMARFQAPEARNLLPRIIQDLVDSGVVKETQGRVTYNLPTGG